MNEEERENMIDEVTSDVLDAYFASRSPLPGNGALGDALVGEFKSTVEIADELSQIIPIPIVDIVIYMKTHDYVLKTAEDGTVKWEIWRDMKSLW
jgi:hypothetical protein